MAATLGGLAIAVSLPQDAPPGSREKFVQGAPAAKISVAGSVAQRALRDQTSARASRSSPAEEVASQAAATHSPLPGSSPAEEAPCHVSYSIVPEGSTQYTMVIVIANSSSVTVNGWALRWEFPAGQKILYGWNAIVTNGPDGGVATDIQTNQVIPAGGSATIAFVGTRTAWVPTPSGFTLNGEACLWQPTVTVSTGATAGTRARAPTTPTPLKGGTTS
jgi:mannan endo-1,4-beta-mannosidase